MDGGERFVGTAMLVMAFVLWLEITARVLWSMVLYPSFLGLAWTGLILVGLVILIRFGVYLWGDP